jgi:hypothetical protein
MKKIITVLLTIIACLGVSVAQNSSVNSLTFGPRYTVSTLPAAASNNKRIFEITDGTTGADCTVGGGSSVNLCQSNGSVYASLNTNSITSIVTANQIAAAAKCNDISVSANTITCNPTNALTAYVDGTLLEVKVANTDTGATTINVSSIGSKNVKSSLGNPTALSGGELAAGSTYLLYYDGTQFVMMNDFAWVDAATFPGATADVQIANAITAGCTSRSAVVEARNLVSPVFVANPFQALIGAGYKPSCTGILLLPSGVVTVNVPLIIPGGWRVLGVGANDTLNNANSTEILASATNFKGPYSAGTAANAVCSGTPLTCAITGTTTSWTTANISLGMRFTMCTAAITGTACGGTPAANAVTGLITTITDSTHITITTNQAYSSNTASSYVIVPSVVEMGDESGVASQPGNFDVGIGGFVIQTNNITGVNGLANYSCQNLCHFIDSIFIHPAPSAIGFDMESPQAQNSGPFYPLWVVGQTGGCNTSTIGIVVRASTSMPFALDNASVFLNQCGAVGTGIAVEGPMTLNNAHVGVSSTAGTGVAVDVGDAVTCPQICEGGALAANGAAINNLNITANGLTGLKFGSTARNFIASKIVDASSGGYTNLFAEGARGCTIPISTVRLETYIVGDSASTYYSSSEATSTGTGSCTGMGTLGIITGVIGTASTTPNFCATDTGSANAYAIAPSPAATLTTNTWVCFQVANANTTASTLAVNGLAAKNLTKNGNTALANGDLFTGTYYIAIYDGTEWQLVTNIPGSLSASSTTLSNNVIPKGAGAHKLTNGGITDNVNITSSEIFSGGNTVRLTADSSGITATTPGTTFLTLGTLIANTNYSFTCEILYSQATAAVLDGFSVQAATNAATDWDAWGTMYTADPLTGTVVGSQSSALRVTTTTATPIVTATPAATATVYQARIAGNIQVGASVPTINILAFTGNASDAVTIKAGSFCSVHI